MVVMIKKLSLSHLTKMTNNYGKVKKKKWFSDGGEKFQKSFYVFIGLEIFGFSCVNVSKKRAGAGPSMILLIMDKKKECKSQSDRESVNLFFFCSFL